MEQIFSNLVIAWVLFLSSCFSASLTYISIEKQRKLDVITNNSIIEMKKSGLDDKKIIYKIEDYPKTDFDVSTTALKQLKKENISPEIISLITDKQEKNKLYYDFDTYLSHV